MQTTTTVNSMTAVFDNTPTRSAQVGGQRATELTTGHTFRGDVKSRRSTRSFMLDLLVAACMIATVSGQSAGASFNFEISKRTEAAVRTFMQPPVLVNQMSENGYRVGAVSIDNNPSVRKWEFSMMISFDTLYMVYAGFENGFFTGYIKTSDDAGDTAYKYTERECGDNDAPCGVRKYWWADTKTGVANPNGLGVIRNRTYDIRGRPFYKETKAAGKIIWSSIYAFFSTNELGLTHCQPVFDSENTFSGVLVVDYTLGTIDNFLTEEFSKSDRSVFMVEHDTGLLVASSTLDPLLRVIEGEEKPQRVPAVNSTDGMISGVSRFLDEQGWPETLVVNNGSYIQVKNYQDGTINWDIVVVMPADSAADNIMPGTGLYTGILVIVALGVIMNIVVLLIMLVGRKKNIWKAAQPMFLAAFGASSIFVNLSTLVFLGENNPSTCLARPWVFNVAFTSLFAILFVKVHRVNALFNNKKMKKVRMGPMVLFRRVSMIIMCEVVIQLVWAIVDPNAAVVELGTGPQGEWVETIVCKSQSPAFAGIAIGFKAMLIIWGCILAWKTRNVHGAFAESKQIMMVMYQIGFLSLIVLLLYYFLNVSAASKVLIQAIVVLCVSLLSAILLFGTRIFQLYTTGDIDLQEIVRQQTMMTSQTHMQHTYDASRETELEDEIEELKRKLKSATIHPLPTGDIEIGGSNNTGA